MPKFLEQLLQQAAAAKGLTGRAADRYTFGAMNDMKVMRGNQETAKGRAMDAKHSRDVAAGRASNPTTGPINESTAPRPGNAPSPTPVNDTMAPRQPRVALTGSLPHPHRNLGNFLHPPKRRR